MLVTANELDGLVAKMYEQVKQGDTKLVKEVHAIISGMKAYYTWMAVDGMEVARQCCGGAGFSMHSGIPHLVQDYTPYITLEGDNTVMSLQAARALFKDMKSVLKGEKLTGYTAYLNNAKEIVQRKPLFKNQGEIYLEILEEMMTIRAASEILSVTEEIMNSKLPLETMWNEVVQVDLVNMVRSHSMLLTFQAFRRTCENTSISESLRRQLTRCIRLFASNDLLNNSVSLHTCGYFSQEHQDILREYYKNQLKDFRPHALNIIESFFHSDNVLNSCIGNQYGDIYEQQLEWAKNSALNKKGALPAFDKYMKPFYTSKI
jgi:hypothetical protein